MKLKFKWEPEVYALSWAWVKCSLLGHKESVLIMWRDQMVRCCPRCGAEA